MKKAILFGAAAAVLAASAPALAQPARSGAGDRIVTRADMQDRVRSNFMRVDANRDGFVTRAEAQAVAGERRGGRREARAERRENRGERRAAQFARLDANRDGMISRAEFSAPRARGDRAELRQQRAERRANRMERRGQRGGGGFGLRAFERQDANRDGRLSLAEAIRARLVRFERLDLDRDGRLTREERQRARAERRDRRS